MDNDVRWLVAAREGLRDAARIQQAAADALALVTLQAAAVVARCLQRGNKIILYGNGGSAADAQHIAAEFVGRFRRDRAPLAALSLTADTSCITAIANDYGYDQVFARQIAALGVTGDVAIAISTSGRSQNVLNAVRVAREKGLTVIALTGGEGQPLADEADLPIVVPAHSTPRIQEVHIIVGHAICELAELMLLEGIPDVRATGEHPSTMPGKVVHLEDLVVLRTLWRTQNKIVIWTNGCFDILHVGHLRLLQAARKLGDVLVVGVNSDEAVRRLKGPARPVVPASARVELLAGLECVDYVVLFDDLTPQRVLERLRPDVHVKGQDYEPPNGKAIPEMDTVLGYGGRMEFVPLYEQWSTTKLIERIQRAGAGEDRTCCGLS